jgi:hypothetical protein
MCGNNGPAYDRLCETCQWKHAHTSTYTQRARVGFQKHITRILIAVWLLFTAKASQAANSLFFWKVRLYIGILHTIFGVSWSTGLSVIPFINVPLPDKNPSRSKYSNAFHQSSAVTKLTSSHKSIPTAVILGVKRPGPAVNHPFPSNPEVKERVEPHLKSPSVPSWYITGWILPSTFTFEMSTRNIFWGGLKADGA